MDLHLESLRALLTGSSRGLGYATARALAQEGARVAINGRDPARVEAAAARLRAETGAEVLALPGDLAHPATPAALVDAVAAAWGGLDLLFTNTGGPPPGPFADFDDVAWQGAVDLCLLAHVRLIRAALPHLERSPAASVLAVTSNSIKQPIPNLVLSNSVRAATASLTKTLALELGPLGIRVNAILPGWTATERVQELMQARAQTRGTSVDEETLRQAAESPLGRLGRPEEFANAAAFLLSPAASYITGVMLLVDGGMTKSTF